MHSTAQRKAQMTEAADGGSGQEQKRQVNCHVEGAANRSGEAKVFQPGVRDVAVYNNAGLGWF